MVLNVNDDDDEDEYDLVSNPDSARVVFEPPPSSVAHTSFETARFTPQDIQANVRRALPDRPHLFDTVRIYVDGTFDIFNVGHALQLRQAKLSFPTVYLLVGVFSDQLMANYGYASYLPHVERCELVRHCRWVDEVVPEAPWIIDHEFLQQRKIQYICVEDGITVDPSCDKARLKGYDEIKSLGKAIPTRRTIGLVPATRIATCPSTPIYHGHSLPRTLSSASLHTRPPLAS